MCDAKTFLLQVKLYNTHIDMQLAEIARLDDQATKITATLKPDIVSGGGNHDKIGDCASALADLKSECNQIIAAYRKLKRHVEDVVRKVSDPDQVKVIYKLYFFDKTWNEIAKEMNMSERNAQIIHGQALQSVNKILREELLRDIS